MSEIFEKMEKTRNIRPSSLNTYISALRQVHKDVVGDKDIKNLKFLTDFDKVMTTINKLDKITSKKNRLTSIIVALTTDKEKYEKLIEKYTHELNSLSDSYQKFLERQEKTESQKENWLDYEGLLKIQQKIKRDIKERNLLKKNPKDLTNKEYSKIQSYVLYSVYLKHPMRNDFANMRVITEKDYKKLDKEDLENENFLVLKPDNKKEFQISNYKTSDKYGKLTLEVDEQLNKILNVWLKINKSGFLFTQIRGNRTEPMSSNGVTKALQSISKKYAGKSIGSSLIRHIVISHMLKGQPTIAEKKEEEKEIQQTFAHSKATNDMYRKID
jgi:integrase